MGRTRRIRFGLAILATACVAAVSAAGCSTTGGVATGPDLGGGPTPGAQPGNPDATQGGIDIRQIEPRAGGPGALDTRAAGTPPAQPAPGNADLAGAIDRIRAGLPEGTGIAFGRVGDGASVVEAGESGPDTAWSTIKVPLAIAAQRAGTGQSTDVAAALTLSDNDAAQRLWESLGGDQQAAPAVEMVLREGGDAATQVPRTRLRPGFTVFGQAQWSLADQVRFASQLPCMAGAPDVYPMMGLVDPAQRWGIGRLAGAHFKGGWGPGVTGGYLARQFGVVDAPGGQLAVAVTAHAGSFEAAQQQLGTVAAALQGVLGALAGGSCTGR